MSRRIETRTEITDKDLAIQALEQADVKYDVSGDYIYLRSGSFNNAQINLRTGVISGDSDFGHTEAKFGVLRQYYTEAKVRDAFLKEGASIESRQVNDDGEIVLTWSMG